MGTDKRTRQKANRAAKSAEQAKAAQRARLRRTVIRAAVIGVIVFAVVLTFQFGRDGVTTTEPSTTSTTIGADDAAPPAWAAFAALPTACGDRPPPEPPTTQQWTEPEDLGLDDPVTAELVTSCGTITIELDPALAPESVNSFVFLAEQGYFDRQAMHRSVPSFVAQGGDPTASGTGGPGYTVADEFPEVGTPYPRGTVALAHSAAPDSSGSQFFIVYDDEGAAALGSDESLLFNLLGEVTDGFDVLDAIEAIPVDGETPTEGIFIETVRVTR